MLNLIKDAFGWDHVLTSDLRRLVHPLVLTGFSAGNGFHHIQGDLVYHEKLESN